MSNILFQTQQRPSRKKVMAFWRQSGNEGEGGNTVENPEKATPPCVGFWRSNSKDFGKTFLENAAKNMELHKTSKKIAILLRM